MNKDKKYVFEIIVRETENLEKICSTITACDYTFEELKGRKADHEILNCKDILLDHLPKKELEKYFKDSQAPFIGATQKENNAETYYERVEDGEIFIKDKETNNFYNVNMQEFKDKGHFVFAYTEEIMNRLVKKGCFRKIYKKINPEIVKDISKESEGEEVCYGYMRVLNGEVYIREKETNRFYSKLMPQIKIDGDAINYYTEEELEESVKRGQFRKIYK